MVLCVLVYYSQHPLRTLTSFFFQAEEGIRDGHVTGVQTCALPIFWPGLETESVSSISNLDRVLPLQEPELSINKPGPTLARAENALILDYQYLDINGDGKMDLAFVEYRGSNLELYAAQLAADEAIYGPAQRIKSFNMDISSRTPFSLHVVDYNGDGRQDIITRHEDPQGGLSWRLFHSTPKSDGTGWELKEETSIKIGRAHV